MLGVTQNVISNVMCVTVFKLYKLIKRVMVVMTKVLLFPSAGRGGGWELFEIHVVIVTS